MPPTLPKAPGSFSTHQHESDDQIPKSQDIEFGMPKAGQAKVDSARNMPQSLSSLRTQLLENIASTPILGNSGNDHKRSDTS